MQTESAPLISLVVATLGQRESICSLLNSVARQGFAPQEIEVIVVVQGRDPSALEDWLRPYGSQMKIVCLGAPPGLSRARNVGVSVAKGDIVAFPDDDCTYPAGVLASVVQMFQGCQELALLAVPYGEVGEDFVKVHPKFSSRPEILSVRNIFSNVSSVGLFVRRERVRGWFLEEIGAGTDLPAGEEVEFVYRQVAGGAFGIYLPHIRVNHAVRLQNDPGRDVANMAVLTLIALRTLSPRLLLRVLGRLVKSLIGGLGWPFFWGRLRGVKEGVRLWLIEKGRSGQAQGKRGSHEG